MVGILVTAGLYLVLDKLQEGRRFSWVDYRLRKRKLQQLSFVCSPFSIDFRTSIVPASTLIDYL